MASRCRLPGPSAEVGTARAGEPFRGAMRQALICRRQYYFADQLVICSPLRRPDWCAFMPLIVMARQARIHIWWPAFPSNRATRNACRRRAHQCVRRSAGPAQRFVGKRCLLPRQWFLASSLRRVCNPAPLACPLRSRSTSAAFRFFFAPPCSSWRRGDHFLSLAPGPTSCLVESFSSMWTMIQQAVVAPGEAPSKGQTIEESANCTISGAELQRAGAYLVPFRMILDALSCHFDSPV